MNEGQPNTPEQPETQYKKIDSFVTGLYYCMKVIKKTDDIRVNTLNITHADISQELQEGTLSVGDALRKLNGVLNLMKTIAAKLEIPTDEEDLKLYYQMSIEKLDASRGGGSDTLLKDIDPDKK